VVAEGVAAGLAAVLTMLIADPGDPAFSVKRIARALSVGVSSLP
jgi:hypothetical protein